MGKYMVEGLQAKCKESGYKPIKNHTVNFGNGIENLLLEWDFHLQIKAENYRKAIKKFIEKYNLGLDILEENFSWKDVKVKWEENFSNCVMYSFQTVLPAVQEGNQKVENKITILKAYIYKLINPDDSDVKDGKKWLKNENINGEDFRVVRSRAPSYSQFLYQYHFLKNCKVNDNIVKAFGTAADNKNEGIEKVKSKILNNDYDDKWVVTKNDNI